MTDLDHIVAELRGFLSLPRLERINTLTLAGPDDYAALLTAVATLVLNARRINAAVLKHAEEHLDEVQLTQLLDLVHRQRLAERLDDVPPGGEA